MQALIMNSDNTIIGIANKIEWGVYDEPFEKWALYNENDKVMYYVAANNTDFSVQEVVGDIPEDYFMYSDKYFLENGSFVENPNWVAPPKATEERINDMENFIRILTEE